MWCDHRFADFTRDVDAPVLPAGIGVAAVPELLQELS